MPVRARLLVPTLLTWAVACGGTTAPPPRTELPPETARPAPPPEPPAATPRAEPGLPPPPSLASRLGGREGIARLVHATLEKVATDRRVARMLQGPNREDVEARMVGQLCVASGGDCPVDGPSLELAHWGERVTDRQFDAFLADLTAAMSELGIGEVEQNEMLAVVGPLRARVVQPAAPPVDRPEPRR